jgi:mRNA interferase HigB
VSSPERSDDRVSSNRLYHPNRAAGTNPTRRPRRRLGARRARPVGFCRVHPDVEEALDHWYHAVRKAQWRNFSDLRATFGSADQVGKFVVFNIGGNTYRLIAQIYDNDTVALIRHVLTHKE